MCVFVIPLGSDTLSLTMAATIYRCLKKAVTCPQMRRMSCLEFWVSLSVSFLCVVILLLLWLSGDVEQNPGPLSGPCEKFTYLPKIVFMYILYCYKGPLQVKYLAQVRKLISQACSKWLDLGLELGLIMPDLEIIKAQNSQGLDVQGCFRDVLHEWLKKVCPPPTWEVLIEALESSPVGLPNIAEEVRKACTPADNTVHEPGLFTKCLSGIFITFEWFPDL